MVRDSYDEMHVNGSSFALRPIFLTKAIEKKLTDP